MKYPEINYKNKGIITASGGKNLLLQSLIQINILRNYFNSTLPIELFYADEKEITQDILNLIKKFDVKCINIQDYLEFSNYNARNFSIKALALYLSSFEEVIWIDADIIPLINFDELFELEQYKKLGHYFMNDIFVIGKYENEFTKKSIEFAKKYNVFLSDGEPETDSGLFLFNKKNNLDVLNTILDLNLDQNSYKENYGDKELYKLSFKYHNKTYSTNDLFPYFIGTYFKNEDLFCGNGVILRTPEKNIAIHMTLHNISNIELYPIFKENLWTHLTTKELDVNLQIVQPINQEIILKYKYDYKFLKEITDEIKYIQKIIYFNYNKVKYFLDLQLESSI